MVNNNGNVFYILLSYVFPNSVYLCSTITTVCSYVNKTKYPMYVRTLNTKFI